MCVETPTHRPGRQHCRIQHVGPVLLDTVLLDTVLLDTTLLDTPRVQLNVTITTCTTITTTSTSGNTSTSASAAFAFAFNTPNRPRRERRGSKLRRRSVRHPGPLSDGPLGIDGDVKRGLGEHRLADLIRGILAPRTRPGESVRKCAKVCERVGGMMIVMVMVVVLSVVVVTVVVVVVVVVVVCCSRRHRRRSRRSRRCRCRTYLPLLIQPGRYIIGTLGRVSEPRLT